MTGSELRGNPYVGPRPFNPGEKLYGREDEINELYYLWNAERIVLLHSPSGAGKSSMLRAGLLPRIAESFDVWGPTRVNLEPAVEGVNRYALSVMQGFEEDVPEHLRRPPEELAGLSLAEFFDTRKRRRRAPKSAALLFDQFEEVLTVDPLALDAKREFFDQLGELLHNPRVWALFVLREDYLAPLDPYLHQVPTHLKNRFRIDLLSLAGAREAIVNPALAGGREFPAVDKLVRDLATMKVQQPDGSFREEIGRHVEPVQLQVVCYRMWDELPSDRRSIGEEDLARFGDVTEALSGYYATSVSRLAAGDEARERAIRDWFGEKLITAGGIRGQVLKGAEESEGLANDIISQLRNTHLVRAEERAGATWFELAHDRLIEPVQDDNAAWRAEHLSEVQQRATLWERQGRPPGLLVRDQELAEAERWAAGAAVVTEIECRFLDESKKAQAIADRERRQARRIKVLALVASIVAVVAVLIGVLAMQQRAKAVRQQKIAQEQKIRADEEAEEALRQQKIAQVEKTRADEKAEEALRQERIAREEKTRADEEAEEARRQEELAKLEKTRADEKAAEALRQTKIAQTEKTRADQEAEEARRQEKNAQIAKQEADRRRRLAEAEALAVKTTSLTQERDRELAALLALAAFDKNRDAEGEPENPRIYDALLRAAQRLGSEQIRTLRGHGGAVRSLTVSAGGTLASGGEDGAIRLLDLGAPEAAPGSLEPAFDDGVRALAWDGSGRLAAASFRGAIRVWESPQSRTPSELRAGGPAVHALAFRPGSGELIAGDCTGAVTLFDVAGSAKTLLAGAEVESCEPAAGEPPAAAILDLAVHGTALAAASDGRGVLLWADPRAETDPRRFGDPAAARSVAFSPDGRYLATGSVAGPILIRDLRASDPAPALFQGHTARVESLAFHPRRDGLLASGSLDGSLRLWDVRRPDLPPLVFEGHDRWVWTAAFTADGEQLISGSGDRTIRLWPTASRALAGEVCRLAGRDLTEDEWREYLPGEEYRETCPSPTDPKQE